ncbi:MAG: sulfotransferase [Pseudohongiellaceae bacterium]
MTLSSTKSAPEKSAQDLEGVQKLIQGRQFSAALNELEQLLNKNSEDAEALYMQAVCLRYTQQYSAALDTIARLKALQPEHGRAHQEEGYNQRAIGNIPSALQAFERACFYNPALEASFKARIELINQQADRSRLPQIQTQLKQLQALPKPLVAVVDLISMGKLLKAEDLCRQFLKKLPHHIEAMRLLADIGMRLGILEDAEVLLKSANQLAPQDTRVHMDYIQVLQKRQQHAAAMKEATRLLEREPDNPQFQSIYAVQCMQSGDFNQALDKFDAILNTLPSDPITLTSKGHALKTKGDTDNAIQSYKDAIAAHPRHGEAFFSLANLKTYRFSDDEMEHMLQLQADPNLSFMEKVHVCFALGKAFEDQGEIPQSFAFYEKGNSMKKSQSKYNKEQVSQELDLQRQTVTKTLLESRCDWGHDSPAPIFVLGMPRAGSTLIEQILSSHSQVDGTLELPNVLSLSQKLRRQKVTGTTPGYPGILELLDQKDFSRFGQDFISDTRIHRQGAPYFIDKMPNNFRHIGLIKLMLPNAKIIDARRNPLDCCFSGFKQLFAEGQEFSYSLEDIGQYYKDYVRLMDHWDCVLPGFVLRVHNEDVIEDLDTQVKRMLDFCELPFEQACIDFHKTKRNVRTPSSEQVRRPVNRSGVDQWKKYEAHLAPLISTLGAELTELSIGKN